jgi:UDP-N-acetylmuramoylalanine--D-glutamate ligase
MEAYVEAKRQVYVRQEGDDVHVGNRDDPLAASVSRRAPVEVRWFTLGAPRPGETGFRDDELVARGEGGEEVRLGVPVHASPSHRADVAAAAAAAIAFGVAVEAAGAAVAAFAPLPHRGQVVAEVDGVRFIDDSKATNPHAALAAIRGMRDVVLIAGGRDKGIDLSPLAEAVPALAAVVAIGEAAAAVGSVFEGLVPVEKAGSIEEAVDLARALAPRPGTVLLAPACSSLDMFRDYAERGDRFAAAALAGRGGERGRDGRVC